MITAEWVHDFNGIDGHWVVSNGIESVCCDDNELNETIRELLDKQR